MKWRISAEITFRVDAIVDAKNIGSAQNKFLFGSVDRIKDQFTDVFVHAKEVRTCDPIEVPVTSKIYAINKSVWTDPKVGSVELPTVRNSSQLGESCTPFCDDGIIPCMRCHKGVMEFTGHAMICDECGYVEPGQRDPDDGPPRCGYCGDREEPYHFCDPDRKPT